MTPFTWLLVVLGLVILLGLNLSVPNWTIACFVMFPDTRAVSVWSLDRRRNVSGDICGALPSVYPDSA